MFIFVVCGNVSLVGGLFYICMVFAFLVRMPMFMVHCLIEAWWIRGSSCFSWVV